MDVYAGLGEWAMQFDSTEDNQDDNSNGDNFPEDLSSEASATVASDISSTAGNTGDDAPFDDFEDNSSEMTANVTSDIFWDGDNGGTAATTPEQGNNMPLATPLRLKTPADFARYHSIPRLRFFGSGRQEIAYSGGGGSGVYGGIWRTKGKGLY